MEPNDEHGGARKPTKPYLKKGEGTARFGMPNFNRKPQNTNGNVASNHTEIPPLSLPRFKLSTSTTNSARTDSGMEEDTRPPTNASSLPTDRPSPLNSESNRPFFHRKTPILAEEEHENSAENGENHEEIEEISAIPVEFVQDEGVSSLVEPASELSEEASHLRREALKMEQEARYIQSMKSVTTTPSSYTASNMTGPLGASTPINHSQVPPLQLPQSRSFSVTSSENAETPQSRPFASNRINQIAQNEAQTGISLLQNGANQRKKSTQKENIQVIPMSEHVYDQPLPRHQNHQEKRKNLLENRKLMNMMTQLRDTIAHLDYAEEKVRSAGRRIVDESRELKERHEKRRKELEEEFERKTETIQEENRLEEQRIQRERRELERDRKMLQKGQTERDKELTLLIETLREKLNRGETTNAKLRQDIRARDEKLKKKEEELEKLTKDFNRYKKTSETLEKRIKQMRNEREKEQKEKELFEKMAMSRKNLAHREISMNTSLPNTYRNPSVSSTSSLPSTASAHKKSILSANNRARSVSWADEPEHLEQSLECVQNPQKLIMKEFGSEPSRFGKCTIYRDSIGEMTKMTETGANGLLFQYSNGDFRWMTKQNWINMYRYKDGTFVIQLNHADIFIIYSFQRQLEIHRPNNNKTLISVNREDIRTELIRKDDGLYYAEIFDRAGRYITKDYVHRDFVKDLPLGSPCSIRQPSQRYVMCENPEDFELIEPEFRLRWSKSEWLVVKLFGRAPLIEKTLRIQMNVKTGDGNLNQVETSTQQSTVFNWPF